MHAVMLVVVDTTPAVAVDEEDEKDEEDEEDEEGRRRHRGMS